MFKLFKVIKSNFLNQINSRYITTSKSVIGLLILRISNFIINFLMVPLLISILDVMQYGVWLTLTSVILLFSIFDFGIGHGLRNKFAESIASGKNEEARIYISTTYVLISLLASLLFLMVFFSRTIVPWHIILNASKNQYQEIITLVVVFTGFFSLKIVANIIGIILTADQKPVIGQMTEIFSNVFAFLILFIFKESNLSLYQVGLIISAISALIPMLFTIVLFSTLYKKYRPSFSYIKFSQVQNLLSLSSKFLVIQIATVIIFSSTNLIITHLLGPKEVAEYNIAHRYFSLLTMGFNVILLPFWSAYTAAFTKGEIGWIIKTNKLLKYIWLLFTACLVVMLFIADDIYLIWIGEEFKVPLILSLSVAIFTAILNWNNIYYTFLNGVSKIKLQLIISIVSASLIVPLSLLFVHKFGMETEGIVIALVLSILPGSIIYPIQFNKIINGTATGLWNK